MDSHRLKKSHEPGPFKNAKGRPPARDSFIEPFRQLGIHDDIPATVYDYYASQKHLKNFPFSPDDTYSEIQRDDPLDIDEDATILIDRLGMLTLPEHVRRQFGEKPIQSLREMVLWLEWTRQHQPKSAQSER